MVALNLELLKGNFLKVVLHPKNDCLASTSSTRMLIAKLLWLGLMFRSTIYTTLLLVQVEKW